MLDAFGIEGWEALVILGGFLIALVIVWGHIIQSVLNSRVLGEMISEKMFEAGNIIDD